jgi:hypothetical protein
MLAKAASKFEVSSHFSAQPGDPGATDHFVPGLNL